MSGVVAEALDRAIAEHGKARSITVDHGTEFTSRVLDEWAYQRGVLLDFIRPGKPVENGYIESFNGKLRNECLNANQFLSIADARSNIEAWRTDYNHHRPHCALGNRSPAEYLDGVTGLGSDYSAAHVHAVFRRELLMRDLLVELEQCDELERSG